MFARSPGPSNRPALHDILSGLALDDTTPAAGITGNQTQFTRAAKDASEAWTLASRDDGTEAWEPVAGPRKPQLPPLAPVPERPGSGKTTEQSATHELRTPPKMVAPADTGNTFTTERSNTRNTEKTQPPKPATPPANAGLTVEPLFGRDTLKAAGVSMPFFIDVKEPAPSTVKIHVAGMFAKTQPIVQIKREGSRPGFTPMPVEKTVCLSSMWGKYVGDLIAKTQLQPEAANAVFAALGGAPITVVLPAQSEGEERVKAEDRARIPMNIPQWWRTAEAMVDLALDKPARMTFHWDSQGKLDVGAGANPIFTYVDKQGSTHRFKDDKQYLWLEGNATEEVKAALVLLEEGVIEHLPRKVDELKAAFGVAVVAEELFKNKAYAVLALLANDVPAGKHGTLGVLKIDGHGTYLGAIKTADGERTVPHGEGMNVYPSGQRYVGRWNNGIKAGPGTLVNADGTVAYEGLWENDEPAKAKAPEPAAQGKAPESATKMEGSLPAVTPPAGPPAKKGFFKSIFEPNVNMLLEEGLVAAKTGDLKKAERKLLRAVEKDPNHAPSLLNLGVVYQMQRRDAEALPYMERAVALDGRHAPWWNKLTISYLRNGDLDQALRIAEKVVQLDPKDGLYLGNLAYIWIHRGDAAKGLEIYKRAVALSPKNPGLLNTMGVAFLERLNRPADAEKIFAEVLKLDKKTAQYTGNMGLALKAQGKHAEALPYLEKAMKRSKNATWTRQFEETKALIGGT